MPVEFKTIKDFLESQTHQMVELERILNAIPALAPENGGDGEWKKCMALEEFLIKNGITQLEHFDAEDSRVSDKKRPNLVAVIPGQNDDYCIWVMAHMDVVPAGELGLWKSDPFSIREENGILYGRGVEDNQQGLVSAVFAALAFVKLGIKPKHTIKLLFMADEEVGSKYGMGYLVENHLSLFSKNDLILIPDGGDKEGKTIEVAEKNLLWLRFHTCGKQTHGSRPDEGNNACLAASELMLKINALEKYFNKEDKLFAPSYSTFQPTMRLANVSTINMIPGDDVSFCDCRILPCYSLKEVLLKVDEVVKEVEKKYSVKIEYDTPQAVESPATSTQSAVVKELKKAIKDVHGIEAQCIGIGGGTVGAELRKKGFSCVVWSTMDETAHQPNEYCYIKNIVTDAQTIAYMAF